jgi:hypothetical protein
VAELISLFALLLTGALVWLMMGVPFVERSADLDTLSKLTGKDRHR